tara:strand:+ start:256 stop:462 length:207 start_codon:yes stop_codon:yes gene_type:complete
MTALPTERNYLLRCLVGLLATGIIIGAIDLAACRIRTPDSCDTQSSAVFAAVGAAAGWIGGLLVPTKQ